MEGTATSRGRICGVALQCGTVAGAGAQEQPTAYTMMVVNSMMGPPMTQTIYRNGSKAAIDIDIPPAANGSPATHVWSLYDLSAHTGIVDPTSSAGGCGSGTFSGDWGDPFAGLVDVSKGS